MRRLWSLGQQVVSARLLAALAISIFGGVMLWRQQAYMPTSSATPADHNHVNGQVLAASYTPPKRLDCLKSPCLALTFDDGPDPQTTPKLLDALETENATATFFVVGKRVPGNQAILRRMYNDGYEIGNHSWSHPDFSKLSPREMREQVNRTEATVITAGIPPPRLFRPPYGARNQKLRDTIHLPIILWNIDPHDWALTDAKSIEKTIETQARAGGIMILHDSHPPTAAVARRFIHHLKAKYQLVTVSELLDLQPHDSGEYFGHPLR